jgi:hypothetical protein
VEPLLWTRGLGVTTFVDSSVEPLFPRGHDPGEPPVKRPDAPHPLAFSPRRAALRLAGTPDAAHPEGSRRAALGRTLTPRSRSAARGDHWLIGLALLKVGNNARRSCRGRDPCQRDKTSRPRLASTGKSSSLIFVGSPFSSWTRLVKATPGREIRGGGRRAWPRSRSSAPAPVGGRGGRNRRQGARTTNRDSPEHRGRFRGAGRVRTA